MELLFLAGNVQDLVEVVPWTIVAQLCNLLIQVYLFKRFLFEPVKKVIKQRQDEINGIYTSAEEADEKAQAAKKDYECLMEGAKTEAAQIVKDATSSAQTRSSEIISEAKEEAAAIRKKASADIELEKKKALNDVKDDISTIAMDIAEKVVEKEINENDQKALIADFIQKMGDEQ